MQIVDWFTSTRTWAWFCARILSPFNLRLFGYPSFPIERYFEMINVSREWLANNSGIILFVSRDRHALTTILLRQFGDATWPHIGVLCVDDYRSSRVVHMQAKGLINQHPLCLLRDIDDLLLVAIPLGKDAACLAQERIAQAIQNGLPYDFSFSLGGNRVYCSEFVFDVVLAKLTSVKPVIDAGRKVYQPAQALDVGTVIFRGFGAS